MIAGATGCSEGSACVVGCTVGAAKRRGPVGDAPGHVRGSRITATGARPPSHPPTVAREKGKRKNGGREKKNDRRF